MSSHMWIVALVVVFQSIRPILSFLSSAPVPIQRQGQQALVPNAFTLKGKRKDDFMQEFEDPQEDNSDDDEDDHLMTKEQFYRELMGLSSSDTRSGPKTAGKGKNNKKAIKKPHDNRDHLPFLVQVMTPPEEPYEQQSLSQQATLQQPSKKKRKNKRGLTAGETNSDIVGETLGEFPFEKNTSSGDKIMIDNEVYVVQKAKCQYKYAGGQKFVMVRKILQVKPVQRAMQEDYIMRQYNAPSATESE